jgi:hypothetical protein
LCVARNADSIIVTWDSGGILQSSTNLLASGWNNVDGNPVGYYAIAAANSSQFFRVWCPPIALSAGRVSVTH